MGEALTAPPPAITGRTPESPEDIEAIRQIRNAGREWMTGSTAYITEAEQAAWWGRVSSLPASDSLVLLYLHAKPYSDRVMAVGYGMLTRREGRLWVSLSVHPAHRNKGIGTEIYRDLIRRSPERHVYAEIRGDNTASLVAAHRAGFVPLLDSRNPGIVIMRRAT